MSEISELSPDAKRWLDEVNKVMTEQYFINSEDAGWDNKLIEIYYGYGDLPAEFVEWYVEKYGLYEFRMY